MNVKFFRPKGDTAVALLFLVPYVVLWAVFSVIPVAYGFYISLHDWDPMGESTFVGFDNYVKLFSSQRFLGALANTFIYAAWAIPLILLFGLAAALLLKKGDIRFGKVVEGAFFFPYLLNVSVVGILWNFLLDENVGIVPYYLHAIGIDTPNFLNDPYLVIPTIAVVSAWWLSGYRMIVFRAGLNAIPQDLYEAASLDGAGPIRQFFWLTLPLLKPTILFASILTLVAGLCMLGQVLIMTNGGPGTASEVLALLMYRMAFESFNFGGAAAVGFVLFAIVLAISLVLFRVLGLKSELA